MPSFRKTGVCPFDNDAYKESKIPASTIYVQQTDESQIVSHEAAQEISQSIQVESTNKGCEKADEFFQGRIPVVTQKPARKDNSDIVGGKAITEIEVLNKLKEYEEGKKKSEKNRK